MSTLAFHFLLFFLVSSVEQISSFDLVQLPFFTCSFYFCYIINDSNCLLILFI